MSVGIHDAMSSPPVLIDAECTVLDAAKLMAEKNVGAVGVTDGGELSGVVTDRDLVVRALAAGVDASSKRIGELSSAQAVTVESQSSLDDAEKLMVEHRVRRLFVLDGGDIVGVVSNDDIAALRDEESVEARQLGEGALLRGDQGHTGQGE